MRTDVDPAILDGHQLHRYAIHFIMIVGFRHKGLERFFLTGSKAGIQAAHSARLNQQLTALSVAESAGDMNIAGWRLHPLTGRESGTWSIWVNGNWRLTFRLFDGMADEVDYIDYH